MRNGINCTLPRSVTRIIDFDINSEVDVLLGGVDRSLLEPALQLAREQIAINPCALTISSSKADRT